MPGPSAHTPSDGSAARSRVAEAARLQTLRRELAAARDEHRSATAHEAQLRARAEHAETEARNEAGSADGDAQRAEDERAKARQLDDRATEEARSAEADAARAASGPGSADGVGGGGGGGGGIDPGREAAEQRSEAAHNEAKARADADRARRLREQGQEEMSKAKRDAAEAQRDDNAGKLAAESAKRESDKARELDAKAAKERGEYVRCGGRQWMVATMVDSFGSGWSIWLLT
jgi:hypothetical protein